MSTLLVSGTLASFSGPSPISKASRADHAPLETPLTLLLSCLLEHTSPNARCSHPRSSRCLRGDPASAQGMSLSSAQCSGWVIPKGRMQISSLLMVSNRLDTKITISLSAGWRYDSCGLGAPAPCGQIALILIVWS